MRVPITVLALAFAATATSGRVLQTPAAPQTGTAAISGTVKNGATGRALPNVIVALRAPSTGALLARISRELTDVEGRFVFRNLSAGDGYSISTSRIGFVDGAYGQSAMLGPTTTINLTAGQWFDQANILMWKPGAISGRVADEGGEPVAGIYVRVVAQLMIAGQPKLIAGSVGKTDDRGEYRLAGLPPGRYLIQVPSVQTSVPSGATLPANGAEAGSSEAMTRQLISGFITSPPSRTDAALELDPSNKLIIGNYATPPVINGRPQAYPPVFAPGVSAPAGATSVELGLGEERRGVDVVLRPLPAARISGTVDGPAEATAGLLLRLLPAGLEELVNGGEVATALVGAGGQFTFLNVPSGNYTIDARRYTMELTFQSGISGTSLPQAPGTSLGGAQSGSIASGPPGTGYLSRTGVGTDIYFARAPITVDTADISGIAVQLQRGISISGRMVFEGTTSAVLTAPLGRFGAGAPAANPTITETTTPPPATMPIVYAEPATGDPTLGRPRSQISPDLDATQTFQIDGLRPGPYVLRVPGRAGAFAIKSITIRGEDFSTKPIEAAGRNITDVVMTFTDKLTSIVGAVRGDQGPLTDAAVIAFPVERDQWTRYGFSPSRIVATPLAGRATYEIANLPAGEYYLIAVDAAQITAWQDPKFLERAVGVATRVAIGWADQKSVDLRLARIR